MLKRSKFSLSYTNLFSGTMGSLIPIGITEVLPGDTIQHNASLLVRCSPLLAPVMHKVNISVAHWFIPWRLVWEDFENFITGGEDGTDDSVFPTITVDNNDFAVGSLADYLGVPPLTAGSVSALPFRAYALLYNEWYRDQDLITKLAISKASGPDSTTSTLLQRCAWEKDYFTTSRPWEQKGPQITIPLGDDAPIKGIGINNANNFTAVNGTVRETDSAGTTVYPNYMTSNPGGTSDVIFFRGAGGVGGDPQIYADLQNASAITINLLREAFALQRFEEARARFGSRYVEYLRYLGVRSSDARLQRPEFLGGGIYPIQFSEVLQTAEGDDPVGELRGHGIGAARSNRYRRFIEEHGCIISTMCVKPKTIYANGLHRMWNRRVKEDFFQKELAHIGQQEVLNKEVYFGHSQPDATFGFQDRYDEYRRAESRIAGEFRTSLDFWHFARMFSSDVALNASFVNCTPSLEPFAVPSTDTLYVMAKHSMQARRIVPSSGNSFIY